jgi:hypothetical protein
VTPEHASDGRWLRQLRDRAQDWLVRTGGLVGFVEEFAGRKRKTVMRVPRPIPMGAYADLVFSFGLARLGCPADARELMERGGRELAGAGLVHSTLGEAYAYRIDRALAGQPPGGRLPVGMWERIETWERTREPDRVRLAVNPRYTFDQIRRASRILEPDVRVDPYRFFHTRSDAPDSYRILATLSDMPGPEELRDRVRELLAVAGDHSTGQRRRDAVLPRRRAEILRSALEQALWAGREFAVEMLGQAIPTYDAAQPSMQLIDRVFFLSAGLSPAVRYARRDFFLPLMARLLELLREAPALTFSSLTAVFDTCVRGLHGFGLRNELEVLLGDITAWFEREGGRTVPDLKARCAVMGHLLTVAVGRYFLGQVTAAEALIEEVRAYLFASTLEWQDKTRLASAYAAAVACSPDRAVRRARTEELFARVEGVEDTFTSMEYFSQSRIQFLESVVLAATAPPAADEVLVVTADRLA